MKIRLIVPNCDRETSPIVAYGARIARIAGGFTAIQATGGWGSPDETLIVEPVTVFDCFVADDASYSSDKGKGSLLSLAANIAEELHQICVYLEIDGVVTLVKPA
jgi:hypothetical protein